MLRGKKNVKCSKLKVRIKEIQIKHCKVKKINKKSKEKKLEH